MQKSLMEAFSNLEVTTAVGRSASFEITLDKEVIHSKLGGDGWPQPEKISESLAKKLSRPIEKIPGKMPEGSPLRTVMFLILGALLTYYMLTRL